MRASLLVVTALAGCRAATSIDVQVRFDDVAVQPERLDATITVGQQALRMAAPVSAPGRAVRSGDDFVVLLPDSADGQSVTVAVAAIAGGRAVLDGSGATVAVLHREVPLTVDLGGGPVDAGADAPVDLAPAPDLVAPPDLECANACANGVQTTCLADGGVATTPCPFGCAGAACASGDDCASPADVGTGGTFSGDSAGLKNDTDGSCAPMSGPDLVTRVSFGDWRTVTFDTSGSAYANALYTRTTCNDLASEIPLAGPCPGAIVDPAALACDAGGMSSSLVECGLPPGSYYTWLDAAAAGGAWKLKVTTAPVDLNTCATAGALLGPGTWGPVDTTMHANHFMTTSNKCADSGSVGNDAVFYFVVPTARMVTLSTAKGFRHLLYVRPACNAPDIDCAETTVATKGVTMNLSLAPGLYFAIVDGVSANDTGQVVITVK